MYVSTALKSRKPIFQTVWTRWMIISNPSMKISWHVNHLVNISWTVYAMKWWIFHVNHLVNILKISYHSCFQWVKIFHWAFFTMSKGVAACRPGGPGTPLQAAPKAAPKADRWNPWKLQWWVVGNMGNPWTHWHPDAAWWWILCCHLVDKQRVDS